MVATKLELLLFLNILYVTNGVRRIRDGKEVDTDKSYVVYLVQAPDSNQIYDEWLCGGALVSTWFIITSAACVSDIEYMYAIAGYKKYVPDAELETDKCTKEKKKKVVYTCVPMDYEIDFGTVKWSYIDIALVKVESAYDLDDTTYKTLCSYIPTVIDINYEKTFQKPGTDTLVYGWGHLEIWRKEDDNSNYNNPTMRYAASKIIEKPECIAQYETVENISRSIEQYMICTSQKGEFNDKGEFVTINPPSPKFVGCNNKQLLNHPVVLNGEIVSSSNTSASNDSLACEDDDPTYPDILTDATRRGDENINQTSSGSLQNKNRTVFNRTTTRKSGICQNDHGGPLVTWVGGNEILIGVASVFRVGDDFKCMGPYLYTSTQCNGAFIDCVLTNSDLPEIKSRRALCDSPPIERGYDTVERYISWEQHPSGTADNERKANVKITNYEKKRRDLQSPGALQKLMRFDMLVKMAKDQSILRQQRQRV